MVTSIVSPFGAPISGRPAVLTEAQLLAIREASRAAKDQRRLESNNIKAREAARARIEERAQHIEATSSVQTIDEA